MEDSILFMQWEMNTLQQEHPAPAVDDGASPPALHNSSHVQDLITEAHAANSWSSGGTTDHISAPAAMDYDAWSPTPHSARHVPSSSSSSGANMPVSWNFSVPTTRGLPEPAYGSPPTRRAGLKSPGAMSSAAYAHEHIMSERKRRERINQRFVELSAVIPGIKKMDKATILSDATRYVKELQENLKAREAAGSDVRSIETVVLIKKQCHAAPEASMARKPLPEIEALISRKNVMLRIHCQKVKGVAVKVLVEVEKLHLGIMDANVMSFPACTLIITITAKVEEGFNVTAEEIIDRLNFAISQFTTAQQSQDTSHDI